MNQLQQLRAYTTVVADTGDIEAIGRYRPTDATTNPSLILAAAGQDAYRHLVADAMHFGTAQSGTAAERLDAAMDKLAVNFGVEILRLVPGRVSTEVDARLSFDVPASLAKAHRLIALYEQAGIGRERVLIKLASTWEGIETARVLEREGIRCNMTLLFCLAQAVACAEAGAQLISPFVGRITDWHRQHDRVDGYPPEADPGVGSVAHIFTYFKKYGHDTEIMGASFRHVGQVTALAGCDLLTIAPGLLAELEASEAPLPRRLDPAAAKVADMPRLELPESRFRWLLNEDAMATEKLAEGIRRFAVDAVKLERQLGALAD
ncbi:MAG: transaldolase [Pseudomonadota bacterium]